MKGLNMALVRSILDKIEELLTTEPARMIGYGAAVVVFLAAQVIGYVKPGLLPKVSFDEALGLTAIAIGFLVTVVESIRKFVYSPMTYIEDLADQHRQSFTEGHLDAHDELLPVIDNLLAKAEPTTVPVAPAPKTVQ